MATETSTHELGISIANQHEDNDVNATHELCLDDLLKESYEKIMKAQLSPTHIIPPSDNAFETTGTISQTPFGNNSSMAAINSLYSELPTTTTNNPTTFHINYLPLETISEDSIKELLYSHIG
jgi:hypothetical protein